MRAKSMFSMLLLALPLMVNAAPSDTVLLIGKGPSVRIQNGETIFVGSVSVLCKEDATKSMDVSADEIIFDQHGGRNSLKCSGETTIRSAGRTTTGKDVTVDIGASSGNIYILNPNGIVFGPNAPANSGRLYVPAQQRASEALPTFNSRPTTNEIAADNPEQRIQRWDRWPENRLTQPLPTFDPVPAARVETGLLRLKLDPPAHAYASGFTFRP